jgi:peptide deformylase
VSRLLLTNELSGQNLEILAERDEQDIHAIVFKMDSSAVASKRLHAIAFFHKDAQDNYSLTHSYNLSELAEQYCTVNPAVLHIRQLGDTVLHTEASDVTDFSEQSLLELKQQLNIMKEVLYVTGGVGIAANQCLTIAKPLKVILAGVDYGHPEHTVKAITRYPTALFPQLQVYINPVITAVSGELDIFPEGCLSMQGALRASVSRSKAITVRYQDMTGKEFTKEFTGTDARVMLHEVDHINNGKVYIQRVIAELATSQLERIKRIAEGIMGQAPVPPVPQAIVTPQVVFGRDEAGRLVFAEDDVKKALIQMPSATLVALLENIIREIQTRGSVGH